MQYVGRVLREATGIYPETLIGDDDELLWNLKPEAEEEQVVQDVGRPAAVMRAEFTAVAFAYMAIKFNAEDLRPTAALSEAMILTFLHLKDYTFSHPDVHSVLADTFYLQPVRAHHLPPEHLVKPAGILKLSHSTAGIIRPDKATLKPRALRAHKSLPFVTRRVIERLDDLGIH